MKKGKRGRRKIAVAKRATSDETIRVGAQKA
jgi:hypothetical protein